MPQGGPHAVPAEVVRATKRINTECAERGDVKGARALIESLILSRGLLPTLITANVLVKAFRVARLPEGAESVLNELPSLLVSSSMCAKAFFVFAAATLAAARHFTALAAMPPSSSSLSTTARRRFLFLHTCITPSS